MSPTDTVRVRTRTARRLRDHTRLPPIGIGHPAGSATVANITPAPAAKDGIRKITWAATLVNRARPPHRPATPMRGFLGSATAGVALRRRRRRQRAGHRTLVAEQHPTAAESDTRGPSAAATRHRALIPRRSLRRGMRLPPAGPAGTATPAPTAEPPSRCRGRLRKVWAGGGAGAAAEGRFYLDDLHFQARSSADDGRGESVGPAAGDGDVHRSITAEMLAYSLVG